jgi:predicted nicotinamide N-methyase
LIASAIEVVRGEGVDGARVLDIGAGVGAVHVSLLEAGAAEVADVDVPPIAPAGLAATPG